VFHPLALVRARRYKEAITDPENPVSWGLLKPEGARLWHFDGSLVSTDGTAPEPGAVATLRPGEGRFGGAVAVEEGTTNLLPASKAEAEANPDATANVIWSIDTTRMRTGSGSLRVEWNGSGSWSQAEYWLNVTPGQTYTFSAYAYVESSGYKGEITLQEALTPFRQVSSGLIDLVSGKWNRLSVTWTLPSDITLPLRCIVQAPKNASGQLVTGVPIWWDSLQLEQKPFATSFVDGTRAGGTLSYDVLPGIEAGTVAFWARYNKTAYEYVPWPYFISGGYSGTDWAGGRSVFFLNRLYWDILNASGASVLLGVPDNLIAGLSDGDWFFAGLAWQHTGTNQWTYRLAVGSRLGFGSVEQVTDIVPADLTTLHLGSLGGIDGTIPGTWFDELLVWNQAATPEQIQAWYNMGVPFYDANRLAKRYLRRMEMLGWYIPPNPTP